MQRFRVAAIVSLVALVALGFSAFHGNAALVTTEDVVWTRLRNAAASGNDLRKSGGTNHAWDAGAASTRGLVSGPGHFEFTARSISNYLMAGLANGDAGAGYQDIDFAVALQNGGYSVYEGGTQKAGTSGTFAIGDRFRVEVAGGVVQYSRNGSVFYTSVIPPQYPLVADTSIQTQDGVAGVEDATINGDLVDVAVAPVNAGPGGGNYPAAQSVALTTATSGARIHYTANGADPTEADPWVDSEGTVSVAQSLTLRAQAFKPGLLPSLSTRAIYTIGEPVTREDVAWTRLVNTAAQGNDLRKWGGANAWDAGAISTRAIVSSSGYVEFTTTSNTQWAIAGLGQGDANGGYVNVEFGVYLNGSTFGVIERGGGRGNYEPVAVGDRFRVSVDSGIVRYWRNGAVFYTSAVVAQYPLVADVSINGQYGASWVDNAVIGGVLVDVAAGAVGYSPPGGNYAAAQTVVLTSTTPDARIHYTTDGTEPAADDPWISPGGAVQVDQSLTLKAQALRPGLLPSLATSTMYTVGETATTEDVVWTRLRNAVADGNDLRKRGGLENVGDAGAISTRGIVSSSGALEFTAGSTSDYLMVGLGSGDTDAGVPDLEFAINLVAAQFRVYEKGQPNTGSFGPLTAGDRFRISVDSGVVRYWRNGVVFHTSFTTPQFPLVADASILTRNGTSGVKNAVLSGVLADIAVGAVRFDPAGGNFEAAQPVVMTTATAEARIHYTTDGAEPTGADPWVEPGGTVLLGNSAVLKAQAFGTGLLPSLSAHAFYTIAEAVTTEDVMWTRLVNAAAYGNDLRKTGGAANAWDAGAVSTRGIVSSSGFFEFTAKSNATVMAGLGQGDAGASSADIEFAIQLSGPNYHVFESGVQRGNFGTFTVGDRFRVSVDSGVVRYWRNGVVFYTSAALAPYPLLADASLPTPNSPSGVEDAVIGGVLADVAAAPVGFDPPGGNYPGTQTVTLATATGGARIHYTTNGADPTEADPWVAPGGSVVVDQNVILRATAFQAGLLPSLPARAIYSIGGNPTPEEVVWTRLVNAAAYGNDLRKAGGAANAWDAGAVSTRGIVSSSGFFEFTAKTNASAVMAGLGQGDAGAPYADIEFAIHLSGSSYYVFESGAQRANFGTFTVGDRFRVSVDSGVVRYWRNGVVFYTSSALAQYPLLADASLHTPNGASGVEDATIAGVLSDVAAARVSFDPPGGNYPGPQTVTLATATDGARIHYTTNGADPTEADPWVAPGGSVVVDQNVILRATAFQAGLLPSLPARALYSIGGNPTSEDVVWTRLVNAAAYGNDLRKAGGAANAWDAGAVSTRGIVSSSGFFEFTAKTNGSAVMAGLGQGDAGASSADIEFAIHLSGSTYYVFESGAQRGTSFGTFTVGDRFRVSVDSGVVRYWRNGVVFYTSAALAQYPLLADTCLHTPNGASGVEDATIAGVLSDVAAARVSFDPPGGNYPGPQTVTLATATDGARIHYTTNGVDPTEADPWVAPGGSVVVDQSVTLRATAFQAGLLPSLPARAIYSIGGNPTSEDVVWTRLVNAAAYGNDLRKAGGAPNAWDAGAVSTRGIASSSGFFEFTAKSNGSAVMAGLGQGDAGASNADIEFAIHLTGASYQVYESGGLRGSFGTFTVGDRFRVSVDSGVVRYWRNGAIFYTSAALAQYPLLADASLHTPNGASGIEDATIAGVLSDVATARVGFDPPGGNYPGTQTVTLATATGGARIHYTTNGADPTEADPWVAPGGSVVVDQSVTLRATASQAGLLPSLPARAIYSIGGNPTSEDVVWTRLVNAAAYGNDLRKAGGAANAWDAGAVSTRNIVSSSGFFEFTAKSNGSSFMAGLGQGDAGVSNADIEFAIHLTGASYQVYESGGLRGSFGTFTVGDRFRVSVDSGVVRYWRNGVVFYTSAALAQYPLLVDTSLLTPNGTSGVEDAVIAGVLESTAVPSPVISPGSGAYAPPLSVTITSPRPGATIRYTTNGAVPTASDPAIASGDTIIVTSAATITAVAWQAGYFPSEPARATYTLSLRPPNIWPSGGVFLRPVRVTLACPQPSAQVRYTTDGSLPAPSSSLYAQPLAVDRNTTLTAGCFEAGWPPSPARAESYTIGADSPAVAQPVVVPPAGAYSTALTVSATTVTPGATLRYTLDGTVPHPGSPLYTGPFTLDTDAIVSVAAFKSGLLPSTAATASYTINLGRVATPAFSLPAGTYTGRRSLTVTCATPDATIRYTTDGKDPDEAATVIASGASILVDRTTVVKARAWKPGLAPSSVLRRDYRIVGAVAAGGRHTLALKVDGSVWSWGGNDVGQLGNGSPTSSNVPVAVSGLTDAVAVAAGLDHSLALKSDGTVVAWGGNVHGQLGDGSLDPRSTPAAVAGLTGVVAIAAGSHHSLALKSDGTAVAWGRNDAGQVGDGTTTTPRLTPVAVSGLNGIAELSGGGDHSLARKADGSVWAWGDNGSGQLGDGTTEPRLVPTRVPGVAGVISIAAGVHFSIAVRSDGVVSGTAWSWGRNDRGQLGDGTTTPRLTPVPVASSVTAAAAHSHVLALRDGGAPLAWGANDAGQLGDGSYTARRLSPVAVSGGAGIAMVAAGLQHSVALRHDGAVLAWGGNTHGQLGDGTNAERRSPVVIPDFATVDGAPMNADADGDGLTTGEEYALGSDPLNPDTNGDGLNDGAAAGSGLSATNPDMDDDGVANSVELGRGTDPFKADTDGDGVADGDDAFPLDPTQFRASADPTDTTPPVITLLEPTNATPLP